MRSDRTYIEELLFAIELLNEIKLDMTCGVTPRSTLGKMVGRAPKRLRERLRVVLNSISDGKFVIGRAPEFQSVHARAVIDLIVDSARGIAIFDSLDDLLSETELHLGESLERRVRWHAGALLFPLVLFVFPAYLILLLGPLVLQALVL